MQDSTQFKTLNIGDTFDFIGPEQNGCISFFERCQKISKRKYRAIPTGAHYTIGRVTCKVYNVKTGKDAAVEKERFTTFPTRLDLLSDPGLVHVFAEFFGYRCYVASYHSHYAAEYRAKREKELCPNAAFFVVGYCGGIYINGDLELLYALHSAKPANWQDTISVQAKWQAGQPTWKAA